MNREHLDDIRSRLQQLAWGDTGLDRAGIRAQWPEAPEPLLDMLPNDFRFANAGSVMSYIEQVMRVGTIDTVAGGNPPRLWGDSPSAAGHRFFKSEHGVGSGMDSGDTGGGTGQTGSSPAGTDYGAPEENMPYDIDKGMRGADEETNR